MTQFEKFKAEVANCENSMELQGLIQGLETAAYIWCTSNCPGETWGGDKGNPNISLYGMNDFLLSEAL